MIDLKTVRKFGIFAAVLFFLTPCFAMAVNDVQISGPTTFSLLTADTAVATTITANSGGQVTNFDTESNYIDITVDNLSSVTFNTVNAGEYLKIIPQSGSDYTVSPACPTTTVTLTGNGATSVLRFAGRNNQQLPGSHSATDRRRGRRRSGHAG